MPFIFFKTGNTLYCIPCQDRNYLIPTVSFGYMIMCVVAMAVGSLVFSISFEVLDLLGISLRRLSVMNGVMGLGVLMAGGFAGILAGRLVLKVWNWQTGQLTLDDMKQSIWDFGS